MDKNMLDQAMAASKAKTIKELFAEDPARAEKFTASAAGSFLQEARTPVRRRSDKIKHKNFFI